MRVETNASEPVVLIVDDEVRILTAMQRTLRREPYKILTAEGSAAALALIELENIDLVLSDQMMPGMRGVELLEEIGRRRPAVVRILITGWSDELRSDELGALGIQGPLAKPWDDAELKETLRKALAVVGPKSTIAQGSDPKPVEWK